MLKIENLTYRIAGLLLFDDVNAVVNAGHKVGIVGRNGAGKTTLFGLITGVVEGDQVKLSSAMRQPGNGIPFLFLGSISADAFSGSIHLGEYLTAKFTANRSSYKESRVPIAIPGGPPLAT